MYDGLGGPVIAASKDLSSAVFNDGSPQFTDDALAFVSNDIKASGISLDRMVTFALADTDDGLAFLTIVGRYHGGQGRRTGAHATGNEHDRPGFAERLDQRRR